MTAIRNAYNPDYTVHPGQYLEEVLESRGIGKTEFAARCGLSLKTVSQIVHGKASFSPDVALRFQSVIGVSAEIWLGLLSSHQLHESRTEEASRLAGAEEWARKFPLNNLRRLGIVSAGRDWSRTVHELLSFFNVSSPETWESYYKAQAVAYRKSPTLLASSYSIATWLRIAEREAGGRAVQRHDRSVLMAALPRIRALAKKLPDEFETPLCEECAAGGVALVFVPELPATRISGAAKWLTTHKAMVALSLRHRTNHHFWFTLFHELGHVLLHGRKDVFIDSDTENRLRLEKEADDFARKQLIPPADYTGFVARGDFYKPAIMRFANGVSVAPGIVVGMLQHDGHIQYSWHNDLKVKFAFRNASERTPTMDV